MQINLPGFKRYSAPENEGGGGSGEAVPAPAPATEDIMSVLHYDPFASNEIPPEAAKPAAAENPDNANSSGVSDVKPAATPAPAPAAAPEKQPAASATSSAEEQVQHWQSLAEHYRGIAEGGKAKTEPTPEDNTPKYDFEIPDALIETLTTDDVGKFKVGVQALAKGIAHAIHQQVEAQFAPRFGQVPQLIQSVLAAQHQAKTVETDFYGTYPEFNNPALKGFIKQIGESVAKETNAKGWTPELRDAIAARAKQILNVAPKAPVEAPVKPATMLRSGGARPAVTSSDSEAADIVDTLFSQF